MKKADAYLQQELVKISKNTLIEGETKYLKPYRPKYEPAYIESRFVE